MPAPSRLIRPARIISLWLVISASAGASLRVETKNWEAFMGAGSEPGPIEGPAPRAPPATGGCALSAPSTRRSPRGGEGLQRTGPVQELIQTLFEVALGST